MANLDGGGGAGEESTGNEKDVIDIVSLRVNLQRVEQIRSVMSIASGCVAGICGYTGFEGLSTCIIMKNESVVVLYVHKLLCFVAALCGILASGVGGGGVVDRHLRMDLRTYLSIS